MSQQQLKKRREAQEQKTFDEMLARASAKVSERLEAAEKKKAEEEARLKQKTFDEMVAFADEWLARFAEVPEEGRREAAEAEAREWLEGWEDLCN